MKILDKKILAENLGIKITQMDIESKGIAEKARPGQFVVIMVSEEGERIPLTVVDTDAKRGSITLIFQEMGLSTRLLGDLNIGDRLYAVSGPLGRPTEIKNYGKVILVGGGVGIAEIYPVAKGQKEAGNYIETILGSRTKDLVILQKELESVSDFLHIATDDGSYGIKGFTTDILSGILEKDKYDLAYAVGPIPMMKKVSSVAEPYRLKTIVSLNALMVDATGMCGCCRVSIKGKVKFSCVDGPEFDGNDVNWDELANRNRIYEQKEKHICELYKKTNT